MDPYSFRDGNFFSSAQEMSSILRYPNTHYSFSQKSVTIP